MCDNEFQRKGELLKQMVKSLARLSVKNTKSTTTGFLEEFDGVILEILNNFENDEYDHSKLLEIQKLAVELKRKEDEKTDWAVKSKLCRECMELIHPLRQNYLGIQ